MEIGTPGNNSIPCSKVKVDIRNAISLSESCIYFNPLVYETPSRFITSIYMRKYAGTLITSNDVQQKDSMHSQGPSDNH